MERVFRGIKMETKQQFLEEINKVKGSKRDYLNKLFQYVLEAVIRAAVHKNVKKDEFIISVAKGKTTTIKQTFTLSLSTMVSGSYYDKAELGFKNAISLTIQKADTYTGPTDGEGGNSKEYRVRFYAQNWKWKQERYLMPQNQLEGTKTGTAVEATRFAEYSIVRTIT